MNISKIITICITILAFVSCTDTNDWKEGTRTPSLKASFIYFPQSQIDLGGTSNLSRTVQLQAVETPWKITNPASDWLEVSPMEGNGDATITFTAKENPTSDNVRTALLSLQSLDADYSFSRALTINQSRANSVLNPSVQSFELTREAQTKTVAITANTDWTASCSADWIHLTKISDTSLEIQIDENNESTERNAYITISGSKTSEIKIIQSGVSVSPSQTNVEFTRESQTKTISISSNYNWQASCSANWVHLKSSPETGKLSITVDENNGTAKRTAVIKLSGNSTTEITVTQEGIYVTLNQTSVELSRESQTKTINISSNYNWQASCSANWVHLKSSPETGKLSITVDENNGTTKRTAVIKLSGNSATEIKVTQEGIYVTINQTSVELSRKSQTKTISISSNYNWQASCSANWVHLSSSPETGNLSLTVDENNGTTDRTANISISNCNSSIKVLQHGYMFDDLVSELDFETKSSTKSISIKTDGAWTATSNESWIHVSPKSGDSSSQLSVSVDDNKGTEKRKGTVSVTVGSVTKYIVVQQNGAYLDLSTSADSEIPATGGTRTVTFSTSEDWTIDCKNSSWVSVDKTSGIAGVNTIILTYSKNKQEATRTDTTYIRTKNSNLQDIRIITVQDGIYLYVSSSTSSEISAEGGTRTITFLTSDNWIVDCKNSWVSVDKTMGSAGTISIVLSFSDNPSYASRKDITYIRSGNPDLQDLEITTIQNGIEILNNGHEYVDLGLPSGTLWATCNVGATSPEEFGDFFAWGETTGYYGGKTIWDWSTYKWCDGTKETLTKYCASSEYGKVDKKSVLELADDAARQNWGGDWRIPSEKQMNELYNNCSFLWISQKGVSGYKVTSKVNGNSIFLPAAGWKGKSHFSYGSAGRYWSRSLSSTSTNGCIMAIGSTIVQITSMLRYYGQPVRPVLNK